MRIKVHTVVGRPFGFLTCGYWRFEHQRNKGPLHIYVCRFDSRRHWLAVFGHELLESLYCWLLGITTEECDAWDSYYEKLYDSGEVPKSFEAGDDPNCVYHKGHRIGVWWEYIWIYGTLGSWKKYAAACNSVLGIP